jgi:hypothetical protein
VRADAGPVPGSGFRARLPVRSVRVSTPRPLARPVHGSRETRSPVPPASAQTTPLGWA